MGNPLQQSVRDRLILSPAVPDHAYALAPSLRDVDREELQLMYPELRRFPEEVIRYSISFSREAFCITDEDGVLHGLWGHGDTEHEEGAGFIWLVSDDYLFEQHPKEMTRRFRRDWIPYLDKIYEKYGNTIWIDNPQHIAWLVASGFTCEGLALHNDNYFTRLIRSN